MSLVSLLFYLFAVVLLAAGVLVVAARNPVHSVFGLVLAFCNGAWLCVLAGAASLGALLVVATLAAVGGLSAFAIKMFDVDREEFRQTISQHWRFGALVVVILVVEAGLLVLASATAPIVANLGDGPLPSVGLSSTTPLGDIFQGHALLFLAVGALALMTALVSAAVLTFREPEDAEELDLDDEVTEAATEVDEPGDIAMPNEKALPL